MKLLENKTAIVTGGAQGLGKVTTQVLAEAGAHVVIGDVQLKTATEVAKSFRDQGFQVEAHELNLLDESSVHDFLNQVSKTASHLDFLINNAGVDVTKSIQEMSLKEWDVVLGVNLRGTFLLTKLVLEQMYKQQSGHVVNIASTAAKRGWPNASAYHASKWGVLGLSRGLFTEAREYGVKVSAVVAGGMRTPFILERFPDVDPEVLQDPLNVAQVILQVLTTPAETIIPEVMVLPLKETSWP